MKTIALGDTGLEVTDLSFGTAPLGQLFGPVDLDDGVAAVHEAIDLGIALFDTSPYYGDGEERLGIALKGRRDEVLISTKTGRFPGEIFDFSPARIRASMEESLRRLHTDHVDIFFLHDIDFVDLDGILADSIGAVQDLRAEGKCRAIGTSGYGLRAAERMIREADIDVVINFSHGTLLDNSMHDVLGQPALEGGVSLINASAVALGALTPAVETRPDDSFMAPSPVLAAARAMSAECRARGTDIAFLANQYAAQRSGTSTTIIGTTSIAHLRSAVEAATTPIDEDLLAAVLRHRPDPATHQWDVGLPENR
jgi:L-galactose dehydrogenase